MSPVIKVTENEVQITLPAPRSVQPPTITITNPDQIVPTLTNDLQIAAAHAEAIARMFRAMNSA